MASSFLNLMGDTMKQVLVTGSIILFLLTSCGEESDADAYESGVYYNPRIVVYEKDCSDCNEDGVRCGTLSIEDVPSGWLWFLPYRARSDGSTGLHDGSQGECIDTREGKSRLVVAYP
jgi:hypothetical protein